MFNVSQKLTSIFVDIANIIRQKTQTNVSIQPSFFIPIIESLIDDDLLSKKISNELTDLSIADTWCRQSIGPYVFRDCTSLTQANFPKCTNIGTYAFANCTSLSQTNFPECININLFAFYRCFSLSQVSFPKCITVGSWAFISCTSLSQVSFPKCTDVGSYAFGACTSLSQINFLECININNNTFDGCYNLISLYLMNSSVCELINVNAFRSTPISNYSTIAGRYGTIFVPASLVSAYKSATNWSNYASRIQGIR